MDAVSVLKSSSDISNVEVQKFEMNSVIGGKSASDLSMLAV